MTFLAPTWLFGLGGVAVLACAYVALQARRKVYAVRFTNLSLLDSVAPRRPGWRRHVPAAVLALGLAGLVLGMARPLVAREVPREQAIVMLVIDVSNSMLATDVPPSRIEAALDAAADFVEGLPDEVQVGLVAFDGAARLLSTPTEEHARVLALVRALTPGPGTAAGEAIAVAVAAIDTALAAAEEAPATIVLLSDGATTGGRPIELGAALAAAREIPVTTIAYGTSTGTVELDGQVIPVPADTVAMEATARATGGRAFRAASAEQLRSVYEDIRGQVGYVTEQVELSPQLLAMGLLAVVSAAGASLVWTGRFL